MRLVVLSIALSMASTASAQTYRIENGQLVEVPRSGRPRPLGVSFSLPDSRLPEGEHHPELGLFIGYVTSTETRRSIVRAVEVPSGRVRWEHTNDSLIQELAYFPPPDARIVLARYSYDRAQRRATCALEGYDAASGALLWSSGDPELCNAQIATAGRLAILRTVGDTPSERLFVAIDVTDGIRRWRGPRLPCAGAERDEYCHDLSRIVANEHAVVELEPPFVRVLRASDGTETLRHRLPYTGELRHLHPSGLLAIDGGEIFVSATSTRRVRGIPVLHDAIRALDASGRVRWTARMVPIFQGEWDLSAPRFFAATPELIAAEGGDHIVRVYDRRTGRELYAIGTEGDALRFQGGSFVADRGPRT